MILAEIFDYLENNNFQGIDCNIDNDILEYGFIYNEEKSLLLICTEPKKLDEYQDLKNDIPDDLNIFHLATNIDNDFLISFFSSLSNDSKKSFLSYAGISDDEFMYSTNLNKISDLTNYFGFYDFLQYDYHLNLKSIYSIISNINSIIK